MIFYFNYNVQKRIQNPVNQISKMMHFAKIVNGCKLLIIFAKRFVVDV